MKTILIPKINNDFQISSFKQIKIKNNPDTYDYNKITKELPGTSCGYCPAVYTIAKTKKPIELIHFYDLRQKNVNKLKGLFITILN
ncbi:MAG: hypothetical protein JZU49_00135 [Sulfuricurvum sp.]|nr:hypothetical protein [Sulfuricurvum sp.]